ncbi:MAG: recombination-associated protein RdgC [Deltaproteobacteria bacterium]|jgi:DNA recombination-dependent growth factor C|nr:recombination-associated protein RdgC [Deltaproteobacteria bacterium]
MGLLKGNTSLSRYRLIDKIPDDFTEDFIGERLRKFSFTDIEREPEESSFGWVEIFNDLTYEFPVGSYKFGPNYAFTLRHDYRRLSSKILNRYLRIKEAEFIAETGRKPNSIKKKELRENLRLSLLKRTLLATDLFEVAWFTQEQEVWFAGVGEKNRVLFEELFLRTFGIAFRLLVPIALGLELTHPDSRIDLLGLKPSFLGS